MKLKYQPQMTEIFSEMIKLEENRLSEFQQQNYNIGRVTKLMTAMHDENDIMRNLE